MNRSSAWQDYRGATATATADVRERVRAHVMDAAARTGARRRIPWPPALAVAATLLLAIGVALWRPWAEAPPAAALTLRTAELGQTVDLPHDGRLAVAANTRVQVTAREDEGALVLLDEGVVELSVHRAPGVRWRVRAGAYEVEAVGTRFRVRREGGAPEVQVLEGVVRVTGPGLSAEGLRVHAGEDVALDRERVGLSAEPDPAPEPEPAPNAAPEPAPTPEPGTTDAKARRPQSRPPAWVVKFRRARARGDRGAALEALPNDFPRRRAGLRARDLVDAADLLAADGQAGRADRTYAMACTVAPRSAACGISLFRRSLSRARAGDLDGAIELANRYLSDRPRGTFARDVLARRMQWLVKRGRHAEAKADARTYLSRWPEGPHADLARALAKP